MCRAEPQTRARGGTHAPPDQARGGGTHAPPQTRHEVGGGETRPPDQARGLRATLPPHIIQLTNLVHVAGATVHSQPSSDINYKKYFRVGIKTTKLSHICYLYSHSPPCTHLPFLNKERASPCKTLPASVRATIPTIRNAILKTDKFLAEPFIMMVLP